MADVRWRAPLVVLILTTFLGLIQCDKEIYGTINDDTTLTKAESPYLVTYNLQVPMKKKLTIKPGVTLKFNPGVKLQVNGTLIAQGTPQERITFTKAVDSGLPSRWPEGIRLVEGKTLQGYHTLQEGLVNIEYKGKWRWICTNYYNWTQTDANIACQHLGFESGNFTFNETLKNDSWPYAMMYARPRCTGTEKSLFECPGNAEIKIGGRICDHQPIVGLRCEGLAGDVAIDHWHGIEIFNGTEDWRRIRNEMYNTSTSLLEYIDIEYAGVDDLRRPTAALQASPTVPVLVNVNIRNNAWHGTNFSSVRTPVIVENSKIAKNRGHGLVAHSNTGNVSLANTQVQENLGDGVYTEMLKTRRYVYSEDRSFCLRPRFGDTTFPVIIGGHPYLSFDCVQIFKGEPHQRITLTLLEMEKVEFYNGTITVHDGNSKNSPVIGVINILNGTKYPDILPQSVTSFSNYMYVSFSWKKPERPHHCPLLRRCLKFVLKIDADDGPSPDVKLTNVKISNNTGRGITVTNIRSMVNVKDSEISHNGYHSGLHVYGGAGDLRLMRSKVIGNQEAGVNITTSGGRRIVNQTDFMNNFGYGLYVGYQFENRTRLEREYMTEVINSKFMHNKWAAVKFGNYCKNALSVVNYTILTNNEHDAVEFESCFHGLRNQKQNFTIGFSKFDNNKGHAVRVTPMLNAVGRIANNTFTEHSKGTILIDNKEDFEMNRLYKNQPVNYEIIGNTFQNNMGAYVVNMRLTHGSSLHQLKFHYNRLDNNTVMDMFEGLNPRSRASAVIVVSSGNAIVQRNHIHNPSSQHEVATHLMDPTIEIDATKNWWDTVNHETVYNNLFDADDRFNLARIKYYPVLKSEYLLTPFVTDDEPPYYPRFQRGNTIGGFLPQDNCNWESVPNRNYTVDRDINIPQGCTLKLARGTTLEFQNSLGMLVQGKLLIEGVPNNPVTLTMEEDLSWHNHTNIRLVDGESELEGRVEVLVGDEWGTICNQGFEIEDAAVVCQMLGYTVHPDDWIPLHQTPGVASMPIWMSNVECGPFDSDISQCPADSPDDHSCDHTMDVSIRCKPPRWTGVRLIALAETSFIRHVHFDKAGLLDYSTRQYVPALLIDYNKRHELSYLKIRNTVSTGLATMYNSPYEGSRIDHSEISNNLGDGILTRDWFLNISDCTLADNKGAGVHFDPKFTEFDAWTIYSWLKINDAKTKIIPPTNSPIALGEDDTIYLLTQQRPDEQISDIIFTLQTDSVVNRILLTIMDYNPDTTVEQLIIHDGSPDKIGRLRTIQIEQDLVDFPFLSSTRTLTFQYKVNGRQSGRLAMVASAVKYNLKRPQAVLEIRDSILERNRKGIVTRHYNSPSNWKLETFHRRFEEYINIVGSTLQNNKEEALHAPSLSKFTDYYIPTLEEIYEEERIANITYSIINCNIRNNGRGVNAEHNHVEFSNNIWHWNFTNVTIADNKDGGYFIELPKVSDKWRWWGNYSVNHSVEVYDTVFERNQNFEFAILGHYSNVTMMRNTFRNNMCKKGLINIGGMEKNLTITDNTITGNTGKYMIEFDMSGHVENASKVESYFHHNVISNNKKLATDSSSIFLNMPTSYTVAVRGLQNISMNYNLLNGNNHDYQFIANVRSNRLENYIDIRWNYWGTVDLQTIRSKIFDFDDWNSFSIATFYPYLMSNSFNSPVSTGGLTNVELDISKPLGGRVTKNLFLPKSITPYIVEHDLTVMPGVTMEIARGAELQFYPNVGILVLGTLKARGLVHDKIKFYPRKNIMTDQTDTGLNSANQVSSRVRLVGGKTANEGFLQLLNATTNQWSLLCDKNFHEKIAEVMCRSMGLETSNVQVRFTNLYDYYIFGFGSNSHKDFWYRSFECDGSEYSWEQCRTKYNWDLFQCAVQENYVFIRCGERTLHKDYQYWGNIRFSSTDMEFNGEIDAQSSSALEHVDFYGAGILHGEKAAAVQTIFQVPVTSNVNITNCASNGYDFVSPRREVELEKNFISNNHGYGAVVLVLNGESSTLEIGSSFETLNENIIPYNTFGLVDMCDSEKEIKLQNRMLVYYKYSQKSIDCVKYFKAGSRVNTVGIRFLQFNLKFDNFTKNVFEIFDGRFINSTTHIASLYPNASMDKKTQLYQTSTGVDTIAVHIHASPGEPFYGFIAEVVVLPISSIGFTGRNQNHKLIQSVITNNEGGAFKYMNVGEINPSLFITENIFRDNGIAILNLTSNPTLHLSVQNIPYVTIANNFFANNNGGMYLYAMTNSEGRRVEGNVSSNVFYANGFGTVLGLEGHHFQKFQIRRNYFSWNLVNNTDAHLIQFKGVDVNFTMNVITNNTGTYIIDSWGVERVSMWQKIDNNYISFNNATGAHGAYKSAIFAHTVRHRVRDNYFLNPNLDFDLTAGNMTFVDDPDLEMEATGNWWGSKHELVVRGRIWDFEDGPYKDLTWNWADWQSGRFQEWLERRRLSGLPYYQLMKVKWKPYLKTNTTILEGFCGPGWSLHDSKCYYYMGGVLPYWSAWKQCEMEGGILANAEDREGFLGTLLARGQADYTEDSMAWVSHKIDEGYCAALTNYRVVPRECDRMLPYICEKVPVVPFTPFDWWWVIIVACVVGGMLLILLMIICFAVLKARNRKKQRVIRRENVRASMRSKMSAGTGTGGFNSFRGPVKPPKDVPGQVHVNMHPDLHVSGVTIDSTSDDSIDKKKLENGTLTNSSFDWPSRSRDGSTIGYDSDGYPDESFPPKLENEINHIGPRRPKPSQQDEAFPPKLENEIGNLSSRPLYDTVFENLGYDDQSLDRTIDRDRRAPMESFSTPEPRRNMMFENKGFDERSLDRFSEKSTGSIPRLLKAYTPQKSDSEESDDDKPVDQTSESSLSEKEDIPDSPRSHDSRDSSGNRRPPPIETDI